VLAAAGRRVTIVTSNHQVGISIGAVNLEFLSGRLHRAGVRLITHTWVERIDEGSVRAANIYSHEPLLLDADTVVLCTGNRVRDELYAELRAGGAAAELRRVGDCLAPRRLDQAIRDGFHAGAEL